MVTKGQVKSISLPCRSHPTTIRIEQEINATKTAVAASKASLETICNGLSHVVELYKCMDDLLNLSATRVLITGHHNKKWVEELVEESVNLLDVCGSIRDMVTQFKAHVIDLQCVLRRRKSELSNENSFINYTCFRKKMKKDVKLLLGSLKQVDNIITSGSVLVDSNNQHLAAVMKAVIGVSETTVSVFESLLLLFSTPSSKANRWSIVVSKLMHKGIVACEYQQEQGNIVSEFESVDDALQSLCRNGSSTQPEKMRIAKCRLETLETQLECMEAKLECVFRRLIGARATLLNIISL